MVYRVVVTTVPKHRGTKVKTYEMLVDKDNELEAKAAAVSSIPPARTKLDISADPVDLSMPFIVRIGG